MASTPSSFWPAVRRARGCYLYDHQGQRWLDLWLDAGRAVAGHRPPQLAKTIKSVLDRGLCAAYPSHEHQRLEKLLLTLAPGFPHLIRLAYLPAGLAGEAFERSDGLVRWRPGWQDYRSFEVLQPILPLPGLAPPSLLLMRQPYSVAELSSLVKVALQITDTPWSPLLSCACKQALHTFMRQPPNWPEKLLHWFDRWPWWRRSGPYLRYTGNNYPQLQQLFARHRILLPPHSAQLATIPPQLSASDLTLLARAGNAFKTGHYLST